MRNQLLKQTAYILLSIALVSSTPAFGEDNNLAQNTGPGNVFVPPEQDASAENDAYEVSTDLDFFMQLGYKFPNYSVYYNLRQLAARDVIIPDYTKRTGRIPPERPLIEIAPIPVTGGEFNDMLVLSHLPGDCKRDGCLFQLYKTKDGESWTKVIEFTALSFVFKLANSKKESEIVAVGNNEYASRIYKWNGLTFVGK